MRDITRRAALRGTAAVATCAVVLPVFAALSGRAGQAWSYPRYNGRGGRQELNRVSLVRPAQGRNNYALRDKEHGII